MAGPRPDDDYTLDDLIAHERSNLRLVAVVFVGAVIFFAIGGRPEILPGGGEDIGPIMTEAWPGER